MKVVVSTKVEKSQADLRVVVEKEEFTPYVERAAKKLSQNHPLPGFRPGKAPIDVIISSFGTERLLREAMDIALPHFFIKAVVDYGVEAIDRPSISIEQLKLNDEFRFTATVAILPEVKVADPKTITATRRAIKMSDSDVERELAYLRKMRSSYLEVARPAELEDTVMVDFRVSMQGELIQGGEGKNRPVHLGEGYFIPDFEKKIIGMKAGEERQFPVTFPGDFPNEMYRGKEATVWVKTHQVQKRILPELNDEFAKSLGKFTNLEELKSQLKSGMEQEQAQKEKERLRGELSAALAEKSTFTALPEVLVQKEIDRRLEELKNLVQLQGRTMEQYLSESKKTTESIREEIKGAAVNHIKISLALRAFGQQQEITATEEEIDKKVSSYLNRFASSHDAQQHVNPAELRENISANLKSQKALDRLEQLATIKDAE